LTKPAVAKSTAAKGEPRGGPAAKGKQPALALPQPLSNPELAISGMKAQAVAVALADMQAAAKESVEDRYSGPSAKPPATEVTPEMKRLRVFAGFAALFITVIVYELGYLFDALLVHDTQRWSAKIFWAGWGVGAVVGAITWGAARFVVK
jgi:hypothetical protein